MLRISRKYSRFVVDFVLIGLSTMVILWIVDVTSGKLGPVNMQNDKVINLDSKQGSSSVGIINNIAAKASNDMDTKITLAPNTSLFDPDKALPLSKRPNIKQILTDKAFVLDYIERMNGTKEEKQRFQRFLHFGNSYTKPMFEKLAWENHDTKLHLIVSGFQQRLPDAMVMGVMKCGTSFFNRLIRQHSRIAMKVNEVHYFTKYLDGMEHYRQRMMYSFKDQITMEKTPDYWVSKTAPEQIRLMNPDIKLILLVREPACRVVSQYYHHVWKKRINESELSFIDVLTKNQHKARKEEYIEPSLYDQHMERWLQTFPLEQIFLIKNKDLATPKIADILSKVEDFLGINHEMEVTVNKDTLCVHNEIAHHNKCFPRDKSTSSCDKYNAQYGAHLENLRISLIPHARKFKQLVNRTFDWF